MEKTTFQAINQHQFTIVLEMIASLLRQGVISRAEADKTAQRIASENELSLIYLW